MATRPWPIDEDPVAVLERCRRCRSAAKALDSRRTPMTYYGLSRATWDEAVARPSWA
ncbi:MAG: hypothetical protein JNM75_06085 [Rhodospirillales bacterium]|nr:hypothetical protein [Rhodospirillales bacterium]